MKVLLVSGSIPPLMCGVGDYAFKLAESLTGIEGVRVAILTSAAAQGRSASGVEVFPLINAWRMPEMAAAARVIRKWAPDVTHVQYPTQGYKGGFLAATMPLLSYVLGAKVVQTWHEPYPPQMPHRLLAHAFMQAAPPSAYVAVRPHLREQLHPFLKWRLRNQPFAHIRNASPMPRMTLSEGERLEVRRRYVNGSARLIAYFGFVYPNKGTDLVFQIADPSTDQIVIAGRLEEAGDYRDLILRLASSAPWQGKVTFTGFLPETDAAQLLAVADAVVLPFKDGGGEWNTSLHAARQQGAPLVTTSKTLRGHDRASNTYHAVIDDVEDMRRGLSIVTSRKRASPPSEADDWHNIALEHFALYKTVLGQTA